MFDFLRLPWELRDKIYEELVGRDDSIQIQYDHGDSSNLDVAIERCQASYASCSGPGKPKGTDNVSYHQIKDLDDEPLNLDIFLINRKIYDESRTVL